METGAEHLDIVASFKAEIDIFSKAVNSSARLNTFKLVAGQFAHVIR